MSCTPTNRQANATKRKRIPARVREGQDGTLGERDSPLQLLTSWYARYWAPSMPTTNPTRFAPIIIRMLKTPPIAHKWRYHHFSPNCAQKTEIKGKKRAHTQCTENRGNNRARTIDGGSAFLAITSGRIKTTTSQPHAKSLGLRSCHRATNVKINTLVATSLCAPPSGM